MDQIQYEEAKNLLGYIIYKQPNIEDYDKLDNLFINDQVQQINAVWQLEVAKIIIDEIFKLYPCLKSYYEYEYEAIMDKIDSTQTDFKQQKGKQSFYLADFLTKLNFLDFLDETMVMYDNLIKESLDIQFEYKKYEPQNQIVDMEFYILVVGISGHGKKTFINSLCNALLIDNLNYLKSGVRYYLIDQQRKLDFYDINKYSIFGNKYNKSFKINIIDTPGLQYTDNDDEVNNLFERYLKKEVPYLDLILMVSKEQEKYTDQEELLMHNFFKLWGSDTPKYIKQIFTFSDLQNTINQDKFQKSTLDYIYEKQVQPKYYQFQNSLMFMSGVIDSRDKLRLQRNLGNFNKFLINLLNKPNNECLNLTLTLQNIQYKREIKNLIYEIDRNIFRMVRINESQMKLQEYKNMLEKSLSFTYTKQVVERQNIQCNPGFTTTFCKICEQTCHDKCDITKGVAECIIFRNGKCFANRCGHGISEHEQNSFIVKYEIVEKQFEYKEIKEQWVKAQQLFQEIEQQTVEFDKEYLCSQDQFFLCLDNLIQIEIEIRKSALFYNVKSDPTEFIFNEIKLKYNSQIHFQEIEKLALLFKSREQDRRQK